MSRLSLVVPCCVVVCLACWHSDLLLGGEGPGNKDYKLIASDGEFLARFAECVAIQGDLLVVSAPGQDGEDDSQGAVYIYRWDPDAVEWVEIQKLVSGDEEVSFADCVAVQGDRIVVGASGEFENVYPAGAVYVYLYDDDAGEWVEEQKLVSSDDDVGRLGASVSIDGDVIVIGATDDDGEAEDAGAAYVFRYDEDLAEGERWVEEQKLVASDAEAIDIFGRSISVSGDVAIVGAFLEDELGLNAGAAYVFRYDAELPEGERWVEEAKLTASTGLADDWFGLSVAIEGDIAVVGAHRSDDRTTNAGSAYLYRYNSEDLEWEEEQTLAPLDWINTDHFGRAVFVRDERIVVGATRNDESGTNAGAAYLFELDEELEEWSQTGKFMASDADVDDHLGWSVALSGEILVVGTWQDDENGLSAGAAYVYALFPDCNTNFIEDSVDIADGTSEDCDEDGFPDECQSVGGNLESELSGSGDGDAFGASMDRSGDVIVLGAPGDDDGGSNAGAVLVYRSDGGKLSALATLRAIDAAARDGFGRAVAITEHRIIVGSPGDDSPVTTVRGPVSGGLIDTGAAYIFKWDVASEEWRAEQKLTAADGLSFDEFGSSVDISGNIAVIGASSHNPLGAEGDTVSDAGAVYVFRFDGRIWRQEAKLVSTELAESDEFGYSVSVSGNVIMVGTPNHDDEETNSGSATVFRHDGVEWCEEDNLVALDASAEALFGFSVHVLGDLAIIGAPEESGTVASAGAAYIFRNDGGIWSEEQVLTEPIRQIDALFGRAVGASGDYAVVGSPFSSDDGAAYAFKFDGEEWLSRGRLCIPLGENFGWSAVISGPSVLIGSPRYRVDGDSPGGAFEFTLNDCNDNEVPDACEIDDGTSDDCNENGIPDECEETGPILFAEPATQEVCTGDDVVLEVIAITHGDVSYQWQVDGENILDATESTLTLSPFTLEDVGGYSVIVTDDCGEISSPEAQLSSCFRQFIRGDVNGNGAIDLADGVRVLRFIFLEGQTIRCEEAADANNSDSLTLVDGLTILNFAFVEGVPPPAPFPSCGEDDTHVLGCEEHEFCDP